MDHARAIEVMTARRERNHVNLAVSGDGALYEVDEAYAYVLDALKRLPVLEAYERLVKAERVQGAAYDACMTGERSMCMQPNTPDCACQAANDEVDAARSAVRALEQKAGE